MFAMLAGKPFENRTYLKYYGTTKRNSQPQKMRTYMNQRVTLRHWLEKPPLHETYVKDGLNFAEGSLRYAE
jgi:hypothetical protein